MGDAATRETPTPSPQRPGGPPIVLEDCGVSGADKLAAWGMTTDQAKFVINETLEPSVRDWVRLGYEECASRNGTLSVATTVKTKVVEDGKKQEVRWWVNLTTGSWASRKMLRFLETPGVSYSIHVWELVDGKLVHYFSGANWFDEACSTATPHAEYWKDSKTQVSERMRREWSKLPASARGFVCHKAPF